jgi:stress response protein YsnF
MQVSRVTHSHEHLVDELLERERVEVERVAIDKPIDHMPSVREEGDCLIFRWRKTDPSYVQDLDWSDRTVEVIETAEQAVVSKSSHIAEEVVVGKTGSDRVETVHDALRRQQVEVERVPSTTSTRKP